MEKGLAATLIVLGVLILAAAGFYAALVSDSTTVAILHLDSAVVQVDRGAGFRTATDGMSLQEDSTVKTIDGAATVVLYESVIIRLEPGTEVTLKELSLDKVAVHQTSGTTWSKFAQIAGVQSYELSTPTTVATVRGTAFQTIVEDGSTTTIGGEGEVLLQSGNENVTLGPREKVVQQGGSLVKVELTPEEQAAIFVQIEGDLEDLKLLRSQKLAEQKTLLSIMESRGIDEAKLQEYLDQIDAGELDDQAILDDAPFKSSALEKIKAINDEIKKTQQLLAEYET